jgi:hypothetical protein
MGLDGLPLQSEFDKTARSSDARSGCAAESDLPTLTQTEVSMSRITSNVAYAVLLGQLVSLIGWIGPLFFTLVLAGPLLSGAILSYRGAGYAWVATLWASAGCGMAWMDWVINREDVVFHLALAVIMPLLAGIAWVAVRLTQRRSSPETSSPRVELAD